MPTTRRRGDAPLAVSKAIRLQSARTAATAAGKPAGMEGANVTGPRAAWRVIRSRSFGPYFVGNAASASGTWFQNLAASVLVYRLLHSPFLLGVLNFCQFTPVLLLSPSTRGLADLLDRRKLLLCTQLF